VSDAYFKWVHYHAAEAECACDCQARAAAFAAGRKAGRRDALQSSSYVQIVPLLQALLDELIEDRVDQEFEAVEPSTYWHQSDTDWREAARDELSRKSEA
jgi:hypothetical protein